MCGWGEGGRELWGPLGIPAGSKSNSKNVKRFVSALFLTLDTHLELTPTRPQALINSSIFQTKAFFRSQHFKSTVPLNTDTQFPNRTHACRRARMRMRVRVCVCVRERDRDRDRETERQRERELLSGF